LTKVNQSFVLAGDFNAQDNDIISRCALTSIVDQPTRGAGRLDRVYASEYATPM